MKVILGSSRALVMEPLQAQIGKLNLVDECVLDNEVLLRCEVK
ncbi:hypothetical protein AB4252_11035 [Vibrio cyclitrophicus]